MYYILDDVKQAWRYRNSPRPYWTVDSQLYRDQHLAQVPSYASDLRLHRAVSKHILQGGYMLEFGVATGRSIRHWARLFPSHDIYGFDSFKGIEEAWNGLPAGHFAQSLPPVPNNVHLVVGRFSDTLPKWTKQHPAGFASLIHVDCDLYAATKDIFRYLGDYIVPGTIIVFDEYWNYPKWQEHEYRAWAETDTDYDYIGYVHGGNYQPVAIRVK